MLLERCWGSPGSCCDALSNLLPRSHFAALLAAMLLVPNLLEVSSLLLRRSAVDWFSAAFAMTAMLPLCFCLIRPQHPLLSQIRRGPVLLLAPCPSWWSSTSARPSPLGQLEHCSFHRIARPNSGTTSATQIEVFFLLVAGHRCGCSLGSHL